MDVVCGTTACLSGHRNKFIVIGYFDNSNTWCEYDTNEYEDNAKGDTFLMYGSSSLLTNIIIQSYLNPLSRGNCRSVGNCLKIPGNK